jgi:AhpD family alkylhydroperoxidase
MNARMEYMKHGPGAIKALSGLELYLAKCGLERSLLHLLKLRASQINGCAFCIDLHTGEALKEGENPTELVNLNLAVVAINGWNRFSVTFRVPSALKSRQLAQA